MDPMGLILFLLRPWMSYDYYFSLFSKIYENLTIGFRRSKKQSQSMKRRLRVGTKILVFRQTLRDR